MLELGDEDLVARPQRPSDGLGHDADPVGGAAGEDDLLPGRRPYEALDAIAGGLVELRGLLAERVDGAVDVGVRPLVVARHRLHHRARLLAGGGGVEIDERVPVHDPREDRKSAPCLLVEPHASALPRTVSGSVTHRMRVGRTSVFNISRMSLTSSAVASLRGWPSTSSATTSADAEQIAHESPVNRAARTCPSSSRSWIRTRSPQRGLTSSALTVASGSSPRNRGSRQRSRIASL